MNPLKVVRINDMRPRREWCFPFFHDWAKWSNPKPLGAGGYLCQYRLCKRCGHVQQRNTV